jgi:hypothetical protein
MLSYLGNAGAGGKDWNPRWPLEKSVFIRRNGAIAWQLADGDDLPALRGRFGGEEFGMLGQIGQPNKWVTLSVLTMMKKLHAK